MTDYGSPYYHMSRKRLRGDKLNETHNLRTLSDQIVVTEVTSPLRKCGCTIRRDRSEARKPVDGHCLDVTWKTSC